MIIDDKVQELRTRMLNHKVVNDVAVVELTAAELGELLDWIAKKRDEEDRLNSDIADYERDNPNW